MTFSSILLETLRIWVGSAREHPLLCYALVDAAQNPSLWRRLAERFESVPILAASAESLSPHLVLLGRHDSLPDKLPALRPLARPADLSLLCSPFQLTELSEHFRWHTKASLPGGIEMGLAFWDPAILGSLVGQNDDDTLHVKGPVLLPEQKAQFLGPITAWWYGDREETTHRINGLGESVLPAMNEPLMLDQAQEDALVEASVPDQVLHHLESNRPALFDDKLPHSRRYRFVRAVLPPARQLGLEGLRDLANFTALCLIYRQRIQTDPKILQLLDQVQKKAISFDEALAKMPE
jgi:hypothetical protein